MPRTRSPFRPLVRPDCNAPAFPPSVLPTPPHMSSADCHRPVGDPCRPPTRESTPRFCVPAVSGRLPPRAGSRATGRALGKPVALPVRHFTRESRWLSRGTPQLLSTRSRRIYRMRRAPMVRTSDCVAPSSPCILPLFGFCTSARVFASGFLQPVLTEQISALRYPSYHLAKG